MLRAALPIVGIAALTVAMVGTAGAADAPAAKPQTTCPVTGKPIDRGVHIDYQGQRIYFCCPKCPAEFRKDPEKYFARFAADGVQLENVQTVCPVSGEKLIGGDMGEPVTLSYKGRTIKLCCNMCRPKFEKDPARYLAKLPGEQPSSR